MSKKLNISTEAIEQVRLMKEHDFTLADKVLRVTIDGKGCDGFDYAIGFTEQVEGDLKLNCDEITIHLDPFCGEYVYDLSIDYKTDFENDQEGFVIVNNEQKVTKGKFWLKKDK